MPEHDVDAQQLLSAGARQQQTLDESGAVSLKRPLSRTPA